MEIFIKVLRYIFYALAIACVGFFIAYHYSEPQNEDYFYYFMCCGFGAMGLSLIRFVMRFI